MFRRQADAVAASLGGLSGQFFPILSTDDVGYQMLNDGFRAGHWTAQLRKQQHPPDVLIPLISGLGAGRVRRLHPHPQFPVLIPLISGLGAGQKVSSGCRRGEFVLIPLISGLGAGLASIIVREHCKCLNPFNFRAGRWTSSGCLAVLASAVLIPLISGLGAGRRAYFGESQQKRLNPFNFRAGRWTPGVFWREPAKAS